ncbi:ABC transporter substrate-binding protein [Actinocorallia sp. API 0066]|uniref:ABC transporter substrate-binding protein n=1 Tax=Actinocorallia sp. API 0066 TaxID=2896846 RepID=UPI001E614D13|nr:ABC transporter substrate-binding protein [Actinocorallia sp. API 0066]MCD0453035.1 ABC transporter substrate-binding protein [Actinocorallia sp. API 0066]
MRRFLPMAVLLAATAACGLGSSGAAPDPVERVPELKPDQKVSIVLESYNFGQAGPWTDTFNEVVAAFRTAHPNIEVTAQKPQGNSANPATDTISSLQTQMAAGHPPDVVQLGFSDLDFTVNQLKAVPLDDMVGKDEVTKNFEGTRHPYAATARTLGDWDGKTYGIPFVLSTPVLYFNTELFKKAGLDPAKPPTTWSEVKTAAQKIKATGKEGVYVDCLTKAAKDWCFQALTLSNGGRVISEDRTRLTFAEPAVTEVVSTMRDLVGAGAMPNRTQAQALEAFSRGDLGMILESSAAQGSFLKAAADKWTLGAAAMPGFDGKPVRPTNSGAALFVFASDPAKRRAAWELIKFMTSEDSYKTISTKIGYLPLRTGLIDDPAGLKDWAEQNPLIRPNLEQLTRMEPWTSMPGKNYLLIRDEMMSAVENSVFQGADPVATLTAKQNELGGLMAEGGS